VIRLLLSEFEAALSDRSPQNLLKSTTVSVLIPPPSDTLSAVLIDLETKHPYLLTYCFFLFVTSLPVSSFSSLIHRL